MKVLNRILTSALLLLFPCLVLAEEPLKVVTSLSTFASIAKEIGGDEVAVTSVASPRFNPHFIEPKPSDVLRLKRADLWIHGGLDLEAWRGPLLDAAGSTEIRKGGSKELDLSKRVQLLEIPTVQLTRAMGDIHLHGNPHYWLSPGNGIIMAEDIAQKLTGLRPQSTSYFQANLARFKDSLSAQVTKWKTMIEPFAGREIIGYHNEWIYLMDFLGLRMDKFLEPKPGIPPSPRHIQELNEWIVAQHIKVIAQATFYPAAATESLAHSSGAKVVLLCQNVFEKEECSTFQGMLDFNIQSLAQALR